MRARWFGLAVALMLTSAVVGAQPQPRRATTISALRNYPGFYHQQTVLVVGEVKGTIERATLGTDEGAIGLIARELPRDSKVEARGQFLDIGRMSQDDPRLIPFNLLERMRTAYQERWPKPGEELLLILSNTVPPPGATDVSLPPLRSVAMEPARFENAIADSQIENHPTVTQSSIKQSSFQIFRCANRARITASAKNSAAPAIWPNASSPRSAGTILPTTWNGPSQLAPNKIA